MDEDEWEHSLEGEEGTCYGFDLKPAMFNGLQKDFHPTCYGPQRIILVTLIAASVRCGFDRTRKSRALITILGTRLATIQNKTKRSKIDQLSGSLRLEYCSTEIVLQCIETDFMFGGGSSSIIRDFHSASRRCKFAMTAHHLA